MPVIAVSVVKPGAVLASAVYTPKGVLLAAQDTVLNEAHLATFASSGVAEIDVVGEEATPKRAIAPGKVAAVQLLLEARFKLTEGSANPFVKEARAVAEEILIDRIRVQEETTENTSG